MAAAEPRVAKIVLAIMVTTTKRMGAARRWMPRLVFRFLFALPTLLLGLIVACGGGSPYDVETLVTFTVTPAEGGSVELTQPPELAGVRVVVPPGAVDETLTIEVGKVLNPPTMDGGRMFAHDPGGIVTAGKLAEQDPNLHPYWAAMALALQDPEPLGPMLSFEPSGTTFNRPLQLEIPRSLLDLPDGLDADPTQAFAMVTRLDAKRGLHWEPTPPLSVDADTITVEIEHFSFAKIIKGIGLRAASPLLVKYMSLPEVPTFTDALVGKIACSDVEPKLDESRLPFGLDLMMYLSQPLISNPNSNGIWDVYWQQRGVPDFFDDRLGYNRRLEQLGLRNGHEDDLEAWVRSQAKGSVTVEDLFAQAYELGSGDYYQAMLLSHNVLRGHAYGDGWGLRGDLGYQAHFAAVLPYGDAAGHRYHLFGMMLYGFTQSTYWIEAPVLDSQTSSDIYRDLVVWFEEGIVSGDLLTEPDEAAMDKEGFNTGRDFYELVYGKDLSSLRRSDDFSFDVCGGLEITIAADPVTPAVGDWVLFSANVSGGEGPYLYSWRFGDGGSSTLSSDTHRYDQAGTYTVTLTVADAGDRIGEATMTIAVGDVPGGPGDYVVYAMDNVACWDAKRVYVGHRSDFEASERTCDIPGGGIDCELEVVKTEVRGGFASYEEAQGWICARITERISHYWCGEHLDAGGILYWNGNLGCNWSEIPWAE